MPAVFNDQSLSIRSGKHVWVSPGNETRAMALAEAAADSDNRYILIYLPGCQMLPSTSAYVDTVSVAGGSRLRSAGFLGAREVSVPPRQLNYPGALITVRSDDGYASWLTNDAVFGGISPAAYAWRKGIPISHGIIHDYIFDYSADATRLSIAQLKSLVWEYGCEIVCHSKSHSTTAPATQAELESETTVAARLLEQLPITVSGHTSITRIGHIVDGFWQPGAWTTADARMDNFADWDKWTGRHIRETFVWSGTDGIAQVASGDMPRHFSKYLSIDSISTTYATAVEYLHAMARPGVKLEINIHNPLLDANTKNRVKNLFDAIAALRDDRATYPHRCLHPVTAGTMRICTQAPAYYSSGVIQVPAGQVLQEDFDDMSVGAISLAATYSKGGAGLLTLSGATGTAEIVNDATEGNVLQTRGITSGNVYQNYHFHGIPGKRYMARIRLRRRAYTSSWAATAGNFSITQYAFYDAADDTAQTASSIQVTGWQTALATDAFGYLNYPLFVPSWGNGYAYFALVHGQNVGLDVASVHVEQV